MARNIGSLSMVVEGSTSHVVIMVSVVGVRVTGSIRRIRGRHRMKPWKIAEKQAADLLGGVRRIRTNYGESIEDVLHPFLAIEVKYGKQIPQWSRVKHPTSNGDFVLIPSTCWNWKIVSFDDVQQTRDSFLWKGIAQAHAYSPGKVPVLCLKPNNFKGLVIVMRKDDYLRGPLIRLAPQERLPII